jgi:hypothetical protein
MTDSTSLNDALASNYLLVSFALRSYSGKVTDKTASNEVIANKGATRDSGKFVKNLLAGADGELKAVNQLGPHCEDLFIHEPYPGPTAPMARSVVIV